MSPKYRDLNAPPGKKMAEVVRSLREQAQSSKTGAAGVTDYGEHGGAVWTDPVTGVPESVRDLPPRIDATQEAIGEAKAELETAQEAIDGAKQEIVDERAAREAALAEANGLLADLDARLSAAPSDADLKAVRDDLAAARGEVEAAQTAADEAAAAAATANDNALAAAGIAADKGRIIYAPAPPSDPADQVSSNLWIDSDTGRVYVWDETAGDWLESENESLRDAAQAAAAALAAAEAADAKAVDAAGAAAAALEAAEAAQTTADGATLAAGEAHNAAVAAAEAARAAIERGDSLIINGSFEQDHLGWGPGTRWEVVESDGARSGDYVMRIDPATANAYPRADEIPVRPGQVFHVRAWFKYLGGGGDSRLGVYYEQHDRDGVRVATGMAMDRDGARVYVYPDETPVGEWVLVAGDIPVGEDTGAVTLSVAPHVLRSDTGDAFDLDDVQVVDVTEARAAAARAEEAYALADGKPTMSEVEVAITASANGKNSITVSAAAPSLSAPGVVAGDTWWRVDGDGVIFGQWRWTGSAWSPALIRSEVIASLDVGRLVVTGESRFASAVVDRLFADLFTAHKITASEVTIAALDGNGDLAPDSVGAVTIKNGAVGADQINAGSVAAAVADIVKARVENLVVTDGATIDDAVILKIASEMITAGVLRTAETGQRVVIDETGIVMYGVDPDGADYELVRIGPDGENLITAGDTTISPAGVQAPAGTFDTLTVGGDDLASMFNALPRGIVAWGELTESSAYDNSGNRMRRAELQTSLPGGRMYRFVLAGRYLQQSGNAPTNVEEYIHSSWDGTAIQPNNPGTGVTQRATARHLLNHGGLPYYVPPIEFFVTTGAYDTRTFWVMYSLRNTHVGNPVRVSAGGSYPISMYVEDVGPAQTGTLKRWNDGGVVDPEPVVSRYTRTWDAGGYGGDTSAGDVVQGYHPSVGMRSGGWVFPSTMRTALAGASIDKFEVYLYASHWYWGSGGTASIRPNNGSYSGWVGSAFTSANWPRNAGRWVTVPSSWHSAIAAGTYRGVGVQTSSTNSLYYGRFTGSATKFRATYRK